MIPNSLNNLKIRSIDFFIISKHLALTSSAFPMACFGKPYIFLMPCTFGALKVTLTIQIRDMQRLEMFGDDKASHECIIRIRGWFMRAWRVGKIAVFPGAFPAWGCVGCVWCVCGLCVCAPLNCKTAINKYHDRCTKNTAAHTANICILARASLCWLADKSNWFFFKL